MNEAIIRQWYDIFKDNHELVEIRILDPATRKTYSGYFTDIETLLEAIKPYDKSAIYFTLNVIDYACYSREQRDRISTKVKSTTSDGEIIERKWCLVDVDCEKPSDTNSSDEEKELAKSVVNNVYKFLRDEGFESPVVCDSANGFHLLYKQAMNSTPENTETMKRFLQVLDMFFSTDKVKIDCSTFNPSRICKLYGTYSRKGSDTPERPQRCSSILKVPSEIKITQNEYFEKVASYLPEPEKKDRFNNYGASSFDLDEFIKEHDIKVAKVEDGKDYRKYVLEECPFCSAHRAPDSAVFKMRDGGFGFKCLHNSCSKYTFKDFRLHYDPNSYNKIDYKEFQAKQRRYSPNVEPFVPQEECEEKGKKWLQMSEIKKVNIEDLLCIPTGYDQLDNKIVGLFAGELTILSGANSCVDCDTEYFNGKEWKKISEYTKGDKVLQYNADGTSKLVYPSRYIKEPCNMLHLMKTQRGVNQCLSDEHNVVYMTSKGNIAKKSMSDLIRMHNGSKSGFKGKFYTTFKYSGEGIELTDAQIRVMCAVICDGTFKTGFFDKSIVRINLKKKRKKIRLEKLLKDAGIEYRKEQYNPKDKEYSNYFFSAPRIDKEFGEYWYNCNAHQLSIIADEIMHWDGYMRNMIFCQKSKKTIDFIQIAFASIGKRTSIYEDDRVGKFYSDGKYKYKSKYYNLKVCSNNMVSIENPKVKTKIIDYVTKDGYKYCFTVPSGMLILRREGRINITGNSGKTSLLDCLALNAVHKGFKVGVWSGEMQDWRFQNWIMQIAAGKTYSKRKIGFDNLYYVPSQYTEKIASWLNDKLFLYNNNYGNNFKQIFSDIRDLVEREKVQMVIIDNLAALDIDSYDGEKYSKQTKFIIELKEYAKAKNIHIIVVCHPRKQITFLRKDSISGTADLTNIADNVFILHRVGKDFEDRASEFLGSAKALELCSFSNIIEVAKNRQFGVVDYFVGLFYEPESRRLKNSVAEHIIYGWEEVGVQSEIEYGETPSSTTLSTLSEINDTIGDFDDDLPY